jgi:hypothetical protein
MQIVDAFRRWFALLYSALAQTQTPNKKDDKLPILQDKNLTVSIHRKSYSLSRGLLVCGFMQFFNVTDESNVKHKVLAVPLSGTEMNELMPSAKSVCRQFLFHPWFKTGTRTWLLISALAVHTKQP